MSVSVSESTAVRLVSTCVVVLLAWAPRAAWACSVCMTGREDDNRIAFLATTVFLSLLPLAMLAGVIWWLHRRVRQQERQQETDRCREIVRPALGSRSASA